ncbi:MAG: DUF1700 domain-containing protein [Clostridia bacterium]|nr:DUF1700 domain-containing protein [Clostridia bacterium]
MRKATWMAQLERALSREGMTGMEKRTVLNYYEEMYQDRLDDGAREEDIIKEFGFPEDVAQSVRENDEMSKREDKSKRGSGAVNDDVPFGAYVDNNYDVESSGYYRANSNYGAPDTATVVNSSTKTGRSSDYSAMSVVRTIVNILFAIVFFAVGFGLGIAGIAVIIASFTAIAFSAGIWLIVFGIGLILFACGCLIFAAAIKFVKSAFKPFDGGVR